MRASAVEVVSPQATDELLTETRSGQLVSCHACDQLLQVHAGGNATCTRCGADLHKRKPNSIATAWALTVAACILYIPANTLPIMTVVHFGQGAPATILGGVKAPDPCRHVADRGARVLRERPPCR